MALPTPELFADGTCGRALPAGEVLQEFRFGQFCPFTATDGNDTARVLVGESRRDAKARPLARRATLRGRSRIPFADVLEAGAVAAEEVRQPAIALAAGRVSLPAVYGNGGGGDEGDPARFPVSWEVKEEALDGYFADPYFEFNGRRIRFDLEPEQEAELRSKHAIYLELWDEGDIPIIYEVTLKLIPAPPPPPPPSGGSPGSGGSPTTTTEDPPRDTSDDPNYDPDRTLPPAETDEVLLAVYLEWTQRWLLQGFSRGRLLQSLALAPREETTIELFTWDRKRWTLDQEMSTQTETNVEDEEKTQDATEVFRELTKKDEFELKASGSLDVQYDGGPVKVHLGGELGVGEKTNVDDVTRNTTKAIREGLHRSSTRIKVQRSSRVSETTEQGSEQRITRRVSNPNLCHTLNLDYYEILTHYRIDTTFNKDAMRLCAMIRNPVAEAKFCRPFIRQHEGPLRDALIDRSLAPGFDAVRLLRAREVAYDELIRKRQEREGDVVPTAPLPVTAPQTAMSPEESAANNHLTNLRSSAQSLMDAGLESGLHRALQSIQDGTSPAASDLDSGKRWLAQQLFLRSFSQLSIALRDLAATSGPIDIRKWGPRLDALMPGLATLPRPSQLNQETQEVKQGLLSPALYSPPRYKHVKEVWDWAWWWGELRRVGLLEAEDAGLGNLVEQFERVYRAFLEAEKEKGKDPTPESVKAAQQAQDRVNDDDRLENDFPLRDYALAEERAEVLERHLREHADHYSFALFRALPPQEQLNYIEAALAPIAGSFQPGFFEPRVVSQIGRRLLVPLNQGVIPKAGEYLEDLKDAVTPVAASDTVLLPSPGLTIEARMGRCSAAEDFIEETRRIDLELREAEVRAAQAEAQRLELRLASRPPLLDNPGANVPQLSP